MTSPATASFSDRLIQGRLPLLRGRHLCPCLASFPKGWPEGWPRWGQAGPWQAQAGRAAWSLSPHTHSLMGHSCPSRGQQPHPNLPVGVPLLALLLCWLCTAPASCPRGWYVSYTWCPRLLTPERSQGGSGSATALFWHRAFAHASPVPKGSSVLPPQPSLLPVSMPGPPLQPLFHFLRACHVPSTILDTGTQQTLPW